MHKGSTNPRLKQELRSATDLALIHTCGPRAPSMAQPCGEERYRQSALSRCSRLPGWTVRRHCRELCPAVLGSTQADRGYPTHLAPAWCTAPPQSNPQSVRRRGRPPVSSRAAPPRSESSPRPARRASHRSTAPPVFQLAPISSREAIKQPWHGQPGDVGSCSISGDGEDSATPSPEGGLGENHSFCSAAGSRAHIVKERAGGMLTRPRTILPAAKRVRLGDAVPPHAPLASPYRDSGSSARMSKNAGPSVPSSLTPICCITVGTSIVPLEPLARCLEAWLALPSPSCWLTRKIRLGYAIQFARRPPKFRGVLETAVAAQNAPVLREEIAVLLAKDAIEPVPPAEMRQGFYSPYFIVPKKGGGLRPILDLRVLNRALHRGPAKIRLGYAIQFARRSPKFSGVLETAVAAQNAPVLREEIAVLLAKDAIEPVPPAEMRQEFYSPYFIIPKKGGGLRPILDLRVLNRALHRLPFKMLTHRRMIKCIQPRDWLAAIDLKDAYFHVSILPRHKPRPRVGHGSTGSSQSGSPCPPVSSRRSRRVPLPRYGKWASGSSAVSSMARTREQLCDHRDLVLRHLSQLGLRVNWKRASSPLCRESLFLVWS